MNRVACVTGADRGLGLSLVHSLLEKQFSVFAGQYMRDADELKALQEEYPEQLELIPLDIGSKDSVKQAARAIASRTGHVDILINNAGFATHGLFEQLSGSRQHEEVMLNVLAVVDLTHLFLPEMLKRKSGVIINVASTAAFQPLPNMAVYGATKAFVLSFTQALWEENRKRGVQFLALCPGSTETEFFNVVGADEASVGKRDTPENVVQVAIRSLQAKKVFAVPGFTNYISAQMSRFFTRKQMLYFVGRMLRTRH